MPSRPTIKDIAAECGVSLSTVSLVLNNNPRISDATRNKVLETVKKRGYQPNNQARGLASKSSNILSVVVPQLNSVFSDVYFGRVINGIYEATADTPYKIMLEVANLKYIRTYEFMNTLKGKRADGMLFIGSSLDDKYLLEFENEPYPFVLLNHYFAGSGLNYVSADYRQAGQLAAQHILGLGHQEIGIITGTNIQTAQDHVESFKTECAKAGIADDKIAWADGRFSEEDSFKATRDLLAERPNLTAIVCGNDKMALGALQAATSLGKNVPEDLSIMGMDDIPATKYTSPQLTTIHTPLQEIGQLAAQAVMEIFQEKSQSIRKFLPVSLVDRASTGPAPS